MTDFKTTYVVNASWSLAGVAFLGGTAFFLNIFVGNVAGATGLGVVMLCYLFYHNIPLTFFSFGSEFAVSKLTAEHEVDSPHPRIILTAASLFAFASSVLSIAVLYSLSGIVATHYFKDRTVQDSLMWFGGACSVAILNKPLLGYLTGRQDLRMRTMLESGRSVLFAAVLAGLYLCKRQISMVPVSLCVAEACLYVTGIVAFRRHFAPIRSLGETLPLLLRLFATGFPMSATSVLSRAATRMDIFIIGYLLNATAAGVFSFVIMVHEAAMMLAYALQKVNVAVVTRFFYSKDTRLHEFLNTMVLYSAVLYSLGALIVFSLARSIPAMLYPGQPQFLEGVVPLQIFSLVAIVSGSVGSIVGAESLCIGRSYLSLYPTLGGAAAGTLANIVLIPLLGLRGAAVAALFSSLLVFFINTHLIGRFAGIRIRRMRYLLNIVAVAGIFLLVRLAADAIGMCASSIAGFAVLCTYYMLSGAIRKGEIQAAISFLLRGRTGHTP